MALEKEITLASGVATRYHRIVSLNIVTNVGNIIEVASYTSKEKREEQARALSSGKAMDVFIATRYCNAPYDQSMTVEGAYEWVAGNVPEFEGSQGI